MRRVATLASFLALLAITGGLIGWMLAQVAEQPGQPRATGELPAWFAGKVPEARQADASAAPIAALPSRPLPATAADDYVDVAGGEVRIALKEYRLVPDRIRVRPGPLAITFVLRNEGRFAHNFHVEGPDVDARASKFGPGNTVRLEVTLKAGDYKISCPLSNHDQRGMHGTLRVSVRSGEG